MDETCRPPWPSAPISRPAIASASPAGSSVISAAGSDRKTTSSSRMMKMNEASWTSPPCLSDCFCPATIVAIWPVT